MSSRAWFVAASVGAVEAMKDHGFARWNYTLRSVHQHAKNNLRSYAISSSSSSSSVIFRQEQEQDKQSEDSMKKVMYFNCWGTS